MNKTSIAVTVIGLLLGSSVYAGTVTYDTGSTGTNTTIPLSTTNWATTGWQPIPPAVLPPAGSVTPLALQKFNLAGETLDSVSITLNTQATFSYQIENTSTTAPTTGVKQLSVDITAEMGGTAAAVLPTPVVLNGPVYTINLGTYDGNTDYGGTSGASFAQTTTTSSTLLTVALPLSYFTGTGNFNIDLAALGNSYNGLSGGILNEVTTWQGGASAQVVYTYHDDTTNVPEPTSLSLLGIGLVGWAASRRNSKSA